MHEPRTIELEGGRDLVVTWDDGRTDRMSAAVLRGACQCAACRSAATPLSPKDLESTKILKVAFVGAYAINLTFSPDGHATGIYPYALLRALGDDSHVR